MSYNEAEACRDWRPYKQPHFTERLGCTNCGYPWFKHLDICQTCFGVGIGRGEDGEYTEQACPDCIGTGRASQKPRQ